MFPKILTAICLTGLALRIYNLVNNMPFFGDVVWFYDSAKNALLTGQLPLAGITSSVTWLHQGPLWTYLLIPALAVSRYHPVSGAIFTSILSVFTIILIYYLGRIWSTKNTALISAFIYALSPLAIIHARMPYHTSVIPFFFSLMLITLIKKRYFLAFLFLGFLYQLELATVILWPAMVLWLFRQQYRFRWLHLASFCLGILPFIISGPRQFLGIFQYLVFDYHPNFGHLTTFSSLSFYWTLLIRYIFPIFSLISGGVFLICLWTCFSRFKWFQIWFIFPAIAMLLNRTASEAYFTLLLVPLSLYIGYGLSHLPKFISLIFLANIYYLLTTNYLIGNHQWYGPSLYSRINLSKQILQNSNTISPDIKVIGPGDNFATYQLPYPYLVSWLSHTQKPSGSHSQFEINEVNQTYRVLK